MKKFEIRSGQQTLGETDLELHDAAMNLRSGMFRPQQPYFTVRSIFKSYANALLLKEGERDAALRLYYEMRDRLDLTIWERGGDQLRAGAIHIADVDDTVDSLYVEVYPPG